MQGEREETCTISGEGLKWRATETNLSESQWLSRAAGSRVLAAEGRERPLCCHGNVETHEIMY